MLRAGSTSDARTPPPTRRAPQYAPDRHSVRGDPNGCNHVHRAAHPKRGVRRPDRTHRPAVLLQELWAGIFLEHDGGRDAASGWVDVHARGGDITIVLALLATVVALAKLRHRKDLCIGAAALTALLVLEAYLGGLIRDASKDTLTAVHVPLGMAIMALVVWIPLRARTRRTSLDGPTAA